MFRLTLWVAAAGVFAAIGYSSYRSGRALADREVVAERAEVDRLTAQEDADRLTNESLQAHLAQAQQATIALQKRYEADVPSGGLSDLVAILRQRQAAGVKDDRIAQVLRDTDVARPCTERITRRRMPVALKVAGPDDVVAFLDGLVKVSATNPAGVDGPASATTVTVVRAWAPDPIKLAGLPALQSLTIYNTDLKLVVATSTLPGYADATLSACTGK